MLGQWGGLMLDFRILGPLEVWDGDRQVDLGGRKQRRALAALILEPGRVVSVERLVDAVWETDPPDTARRQIQNTVSALRQTAIGEALSRQEPGYVLRVSRDQVDALRFEDSLRRAGVARGARDLTGAAGALQAGLALWRGRALDELGGRLASAGTHLEEQRLSGVTAWAEVALELGWHAAVADELRKVVDDYPLREPLAGLLMLALHRCGRTADALLHYDQIRRELAEALGIEPGSELQKLYQQILIGDPALDHRLAAIPGRNDLPRDVAGFTGRSAELARLLSIVDDRGAVGLRAIDGMAGVGKTALAVYAAHRLTDRYPDGQLFLDLHGHTPDREPLTAEAALDLLLRAVGVPEESIRKGVDEKAARWRAELTGRRVLVVLDNALNSAQIRPLLPSSPRCAVLVTSRRQMVGLAGIDSFSLDTLSDAEAVELFSRIAGHERAQAEQEPARRVVRLCGHLPLAIGLAAARFRSRPQWTVAHLAARLEDEQGRLAVLHNDDYGVNTALSLSYRRLPSPQQRLFRLLALHPGPDIDAYAAAALAQLPLEHAASLLEDLCDLHLLIPHAADRYRFHDLTRGYARTTASDEPEADRDQARHRLLDYYLCVTEAAADLLLPNRRRLGPPLKYPPADVQLLSDAADARAWFRTEHGNLLAVARLAAEQGTTDHGWQIPRNVSAYLLRHGDVAMGTAVQEITLAACRADTDPVVRTICLYNLAILYQTLGRYPSALGCLDQSLALARESGDWAAESSCLIQMADIHNHLGEFTQAVALASQAMQAFRADGQRVREAEALVALVEGLVHLGRSAEAVEQAHQAAISEAELGTDRVRGALLSRLGIAHSRLNQHHLAIDLLLRSVEIARRDEDEAGQEAYLWRLAQALHRGGRLQEALARGQEALEIMARVTDPADLAEIHNTLGAIHADLGNCADALAHHRQALAVSADVGYRIGQAHADHGIAVALDCLGDPAAGRTHRRRASDLFTELGVPEALMVQTRIQSVQQ